MNNPEQYPEQYPEQSSLNGIELGLLQELAQTQEAIDAIQLSVVEKLLERGVDVELLRTTENTDRRDSIDTLVQSTSNAIYFADISNKHRDIDPCADIKIFEAKTKARLAVGFDSNLKLSEKNALKGILDDRIATPELTKAQQFDIFIQIARTNPGWRRTNKD